MIIKKTQFNFKKYIYSIETGIDEFEIDFQFKLSVF